MKNYNSNNLDFGDEKSTGIKEWIFTILPFWWLIGICISTGLVSVWLFHRYSIPKYHVASTILINQEKTNPGSIILEELNLFSGKVNITNEIGILKSLSLISRVIDTLDFEIEYYTLGRIRSTERASNKVPYNVRVVKNESNDATHFKIDLLNSNQFRIKQDPEYPNDEIVDGVYNFPAIIEAPSYLFLIERNGTELLEADVDHHKFIVYQPFALAKKYRKLLSIQNQNKESSILDLSIEAANTEKARLFLDMLVDQYIQRELDQKNITADKTIAFIDKQLTSIEDTLSSVEDRLQKFRSSNRVVDLSQEGLVLVQKLQELEKQKAQEEIKIEYFDYILDYLKENRNPGSVVSPVSVGITNPVLDALVQNLNDLSAQLTQYEMNATEFNPQVQSLQVQIKRVMAGLIENIENLRKSTLIAIQGLESRIDKSEENIDALPKTERAFVNIQRSFNISENLFIYLQEKKAEAGIAKASNVPENKLLDKAMVLEKTYPKAIQNYAFGGLFGLFLPILFIVIRKSFSNKLSSIDDVENMSNLPVLGTLAHNHYNTELVIKDHPKSIVSESFRKIKAAMKFLEKGESAKVIILTSFQSGEGKSFSAINFACTLAATGKKVILLGMDLRKPKIFKEFEVKKSVGMSNLLIGEISINDAIQKTDISNLDIIVSGPIPPNPSELLANDNTAKLLKEFREIYDYVILDTSPIGLVSDAMELARYGDLTLFILRHMYTPYQAIPFVNDLHQKKLLPNIGLIYNGVDFDKVSNKIKYGYGMGQGYYE